MKGLISVTPREFKRHFGEIMEICTGVCIANNQEIVITFPEKKNGQTHIEIAKVIPIGRGIKYEYNHELLKKYSINTDDRINKLESIIAKVFEKSGLAEYSRNNKEVASLLQNAMLIATEAIMKQFNIKL